MNKTPNRPRRQHPFWLRKLSQLSRTVRESHAQPIAGSPRLVELAAPADLGITFLGHSSFLIQVAGRNILIDPVLATRLVVLRRQRHPGVKLLDLPPIDVVLLTHAHMDHLNRPTLRRVARQTRSQTGRAPIVIVPSGVSDLVDTLGFSSVISLDRWQTASVAGLDVTLTPAKHWGARLFRDTHRGFGGYVISAAGHSLYHSGDTAYFPGFHEIGQRLHPRVALLPIGAYFPDSYRAVHTSPEEAFQGFLDLSADLMIPMHFGTFPLGREPMDEPPIRLQREAARFGLSNQVRILEEGETLILPPQNLSHGPSDVLAASASNVA